MSQKRVISFFDELSELLKPTGFRLIKKYRRLVREMPERIEVVAATYAEYGGRTYVKPWVGVRFSAIESIYDTITGFDPYTTTVGIDYWSKFGNLYRFPITTDIELEAATESCRNICINEAQEFFSSYPSLESVDLALNSCPEQWCDDCGVPDRWFRGAIVARLVKRENFEDLVAIYRAEAKACSEGFWLSDFETIVTKLQNQ